MEKNNKVTLQEFAKQFKQYQEKHLNKFTDTSINALYEHFQIEDCEEISEIEIQYIFDNCIEFTEEEFINEQQELMEEFDSENKYNINRIIDVIEELDVERVIVTSDNKYILHSLLD